MCISLALCRSLFFSPSKLIELDQRQYLFVCQSFVRSFGCACIGAMFIMYSALLMCSIVSCCFSALYSYMLLVLLLFLFGAFIIEMCNSVLKIVSKWLRTNAEHSAFV